jgi:hypothetical protein
VSASPIPSPADLAAELSSVLRTGVTTEGLRHRTALLSLALTQAKAATEQTDGLPPFSWTRVDLM